MSVATTVAIDAGWATVLRTFRYVASRYTYGNSTWSKRRVLNASTTSSRPPADARHLRFGDPRLCAQHGHQVVHRACRHAGHIRLHDHRPQRPVDAPARLEQRRQEAALAQLGDLQLEIAGPSRQQTRPVPVALSDPRLAALIAPGADRLGGLGLAQLLEHQLHRLADQARAAAGAETLPQLCRGSIRKGHRCVLLDE